MYISEIHNLDTVTHLWQQFTLICNAKDACIFCKAALKLCIVKSVIRINVNWIFLFMYHLLMIAVFFLHKHRTRSTEHQHNIL